MKLIEKLGITPGPWDLGYGEGLTGDRISWDVFLDGVGCKNKMVRSGKAEVCQINYSVDEDKAIADARLIAAAPQMLESLIEIVAYDISECGSIDDAGVACYIDIIEKATGRTWEEIKELI